MTSRIVCLAGVVVVAYDGLLALAAESLGFEYSLGVIGSLLIYGGVGYLVRRAGGGWRQSASAAAAVALVDATLGWAVSAWIGPGRAEDAGPAAIGFTVIFVVLLGAVVGSIGARLARSPSPANA